MGVGSIHDASLLNWESTGIIARLDSSKQLTNCFWGARILRLGLRFHLAIPWIPRSRHMGQNAVRRTKITLISAADPPGGKGRQLV